MTPSELATLENKIATARSNKAKAEGAREAIERKWQETYGVSTPEEIESVIFERKSHLEKIVARQERLEQELQELVP